MRSIILGGFGMRAKHLARYQHMPQHSAFSHSNLALCSVNHGMPAYIERLRGAVADAEQAGERVVLHVISASSWYVADYLREHRPSNVAGIVLESTPYQFDLEPLALELLPSSIASASCTVLDALLRVNGASETWRQGYLESIENPPGVDKVLVVGSQRDSMIPTAQFEQLASTLEGNGKATDLFISDHARHALAIRDDAARYDEAVSAWVATL